jgi:dUTP pyrophosphatase
MKVKVKKVNSSAVIPSYSKPGAACLDLVCASKESDDFGNTVFDTGLAFEIPPGYVGLVYPRSSICKTMHQLRNCVGVIDSGYRGTVKLAFWGGRDAASSYSEGDRIGQIMILPYPTIEFEEAEELSLTDRNTAGFGSTGA